MRPNRYTGCTPLTREQVGSLQPYRPRAIKATPFNPVPKQLSMWGNSSYGDCVSAACAFKLACQLPEIFIPEANVIAWARANGNLNGADPLTVNQQMQVRGMVDANGNQWGEGPANYVALSDQAAMEAALAEGPLSVTVAASVLQARVGSSNGWVITRAPADQGYDHEPAISKAGAFSDLAQALGTSLSPGVDPTTYGYLMFTWDTIGLIDRQSLLNIGQDALLCLPTAVQQTPAPTPTPTPGPSPRPCPRLQEAIDSDPGIARELVSLLKAHAPEAFNERY